ncbi:hypothetical protein PENTCL1PPCAC_676, partial [Pristionchus entomophagus]
REESNGKSLIDSLRLVSRRWNLVLSDLKNIRMLRHLPVPIDKLSIVQGSTPISSVILIRAEGKRITFQTNWLCSRRHPVVVFRKIV